VCGAVRCLFRWRYTRSFSSHLAPQGARARTNHTQTENASDGDYSLLVKLTSGHHLDLFFWSSLDLFHIQYAVHCRDASSDNVCTILVVDIYNLNRSRGIVITQKMRTVPVVK
jgi:hypothetical protein